MTSIPSPGAFGDEHRHSSGCHNYEAEDYAADFEAAAATVRGAEETRSTRSFELWCPFAVRKLTMPTQGEYRLGYPQGAVIHATEGWSLKGDSDLENTIAYGRSQKHAYFGISRTGTIYQTHPLSEWGHHAGPTHHSVLGGGLSAKLVGIELAAAGLVKPDGVGFRALDWPEHFTPDQVRYAEATGNVTKAGYYLAYTPEQEAALTKLLLWLHENNPDVFKLEFVLGHDEIAIDRQGKLGRKQDPGGGLSLSMDDYRCHLAGENPTRGLDASAAPAPVRASAPGGPSWESALLMASASKLVYREPDVIRQTFTNASWGFTKADFLSVADTQVAVASDASRVVVAYRGSKGLGDWLANLEFVIPADSPSGPVHRGFWDGFQAVRDSLFTTLQAHDPGATKELWLTGHSLGGALALITASEFPDPARITAIYTFGQPRAGFRDFAAKIDATFGDRYFRFVNFDDIVPRVPPGDYTHAGRLIWFNAQGIPDELAPEDARSFGSGPIPVARQITDSDFHHLRSFVARVRSRATRGPAALDDAEEEGLQEFRGEMPGGFKNHKIDLYIAYAQRQKPGQPALDVRGPVDTNPSPTAPASSPTPAPIAIPEPAIPLVAAPAAATAPVPTVIPAPTVVAAPAPVATTRVHFPLAEDELSAFLKVQDLLPLAVHVVWPEESNPAGTCPRLGGALFDFLNQPVARQIDQATGKPVLNPHLESGVGIPVYLGHHYERVRESVARRLLPSGQTGPATIVFLLLDDGASGHLAGGTPFGKLLRELLDPAQVERYWPNVLVVPICLTEAIRTAVAGTRLPVLSLPAGNAADLDRIAWQAGLLTANFLMDRRQGASPAQGEPQRARVKLFVSYAKPDIEQSPELAAAFQKKIIDELGEIFTREEPPGFRGRKARPAGTLPDDAVNLIIRSDSYSVTPGTLTDLLDAKRSGMPVVSLQVLREGGGRSFSFEGNALTLAWNPTTPRGDSPAPEDFNDLTWRCLKECLRAWLHHLHFHLLPESVFGYRRVTWRPDMVKAISRPPELLDFVQGPLEQAGSSIVFYPDPPLPAKEITLLRRAQAKVRFATPTTLSNEAWRRHPAPPLNGLKVAVSLSMSPDLAKDFAEISPRFEGSRSNGVLLTHMDGAIAYLTLSLVRAGAKLGFGGGVRELSYASFLDDLIATHKQTDQSQSKLLLTFLTPYSENAHPETEDADRILCGKAETNPPATDLAQRALDLTQMRYRMAQDCDARLIMGGRTTPELQPGDGGYLGRFPGQAEEAFHALQANKPVFVAGGFLGVSSWVARALCNQLVGLPKDADWAHSSHHVELRSGYDGAKLPAWQLPSSLEDFWRAFAKAGEGYFWGDGASETKVWTNGLTVAENRRLFSAIHPRLITALVSRGLEQFASQRRGQDGASSLNLVLFNGSFTDVPETESYGALVLGSARLQGADAALDRRLGGQLQRSPHLERRGPMQILRIDSDQVAGDAALLYWIDSIKQVQTTEGLKNAVRGALEAFAATAQKYGIASIALVPMGVNLGLTLEDSATLILDTLLAIQSQSKGRAFQSVALCEIDPERYEKMRNLIEARSQKDAGRLFYTELEPQLPKEIRRSVPLFLNFTGKEPTNGKPPQAINQSARSTGGGGAVPIEDQPVDWKALSDLLDRGKGMPPAFAQHRDLGLKLANLVVAKGVHQAIQENQERAWEILHDIACAEIPYELLAFQDSSGAAYHPALKVEICRRLGLRDATVPPNYASKAVYRLLIVANPTDHRRDLNLPGTEREALAIQKILKEQFGDSQAAPYFEVNLLKGHRQATREAVLDEIGTGQYDFVHYAGHGNYDPKDAKKSGLLFREGILTAAELTQAIADNRRARKEKAAAAGQVDSGRPPALVILNACLIARLGLHQASLAQAVLEAGVGGFIGNRWLVNDAAAADFSSTVYSLLATGTLLGEAVQKARNVLYEKNQADWANYVLYGTREIRL